MIRDMYGAKLGVFSNTRVAMARRTPRWSALQSGVQQDLLQCPCQGGQQDAVHLWTECADVQAFLSRTIFSGDAFVATIPPDKLAEWQAMSLQQQLDVTFDPRRWVSTEPHCIFKRQTVALVTMAMHTWDSRILPQDNRTFSDDTNQMLELAT